MTTCQEVVSISSIKADVGQSESPPRSHFQQFLTSQSKAHHKELRSTTQVPLSTSLPRISELTENNSEIQDLDWTALTPHSLGALTPALAGEIRMISAAFCPHLSFISLLLGGSHTF